ncbi:nitrilase-related carbon-nitrogen hydrolase [Brevibacterium sp. K11IcPPYGO002]|uniref:nitrilase-related carbon-nitrogen hydrolase n=1 Tax=Brevibacterium sp. K11IcPPYGO002 TaxID=3058837 RepID=UPI003D81A9D2
MSRFENAAHEVGTFVVIEGVCNTLYRTALMIDSDPSVVGVHRNVMPNGTELVIWGSEDGSTLDTIDTLIGRVGSVICLENGMPPGAPGDVCPGSRTLLRSHRRRPTDVDSAGRTG